MLGGVLYLPVDGVWAVDSRKYGDMGGGGEFFLETSRSEPCVAGRNWFLGPPCGLCKLAVLPWALNPLRGAWGGGACAAASRLAVLD
jgi:hypothetical protein